MMQQYQKPKTFSKGMTKDLLPKLEGPEQYSYALNAVLFTSDGQLPALSSEPGNEFAIQGFPTSKKIIGTHTVSEDLIVLFVYDPNNEHEIGKYYPKSGKYETYCKGACLNFSDASPVHALSRTFSSCETLVYFTDDYNRYRVINITSPDYHSIGPNKDIDCKSIAFSQPFTVPTVQTSVIDGGNLKVGSYSFAVRYLDKNHVPTTWVTYTPYVTVKATAENSPTTAFGSTSDEEHAEFFSTSASKAVTFSFSGLDTSFTYIQIGVIYRGTISGAITDSYLLTPLRFSTSTLTYTFQGGDFHSPISVDELLQDLVQVDRVKTHTVSNSRLILGHLSTTKRNWAHFQRHASKIKTRWYGFRDTDFTNTTHKTTFLRDEVYAFGIQYIFADGSRSPVFHIPGRPVIDNTNNNFGFNSLISTSLDQWDTLDIDITDINYIKPGQKRWQVYNTYTYNNVLSPFGTVSVIPQGLMGYYEVDRLYPVVPACDEEGGFFGQDAYGNNLEGTKIRHHRIPNMPLENPDDLEGFLPIMRIMPLFTMTEDYPHEDIVGHIYLMADRTNEKTIVDKGLLGSFGSSKPQLSNGAHYNTLTFHGTKSLEYPSTLNGPIYPHYYRFTVNPPYHTTDSTVFSLITPRSVRSYKPSSAQLLTIDGIYRNERNGTSTDLSGAFQAIAERMWTPDQITDFSNLATLSVFNAFLKPNDINAYTDRRLFSLRDLRLLEASATVQANGVMFRDTLFQNSSQNTSIYAVDLNQPFNPVSGTLPHDYFCKTGTVSTSLDYRIRGDGGQAWQRILKVSLKNDVNVFTNLESLLYKPIVKGPSVKEPNSDSLTLADWGDTFISVFEILDYFYYNNFTSLSVVGHNMTDLVPNATKFLVVGHLIQTAIESPYNVSLRLNSSDAKKNNFYPPLQLPSPSDKTSVAKALNAYFVSKVDGQTQGSAKHYFIGPQIYFYNLSFDYILAEKSYITHLPTRCTDCESDFPNRIFYSYPSETDTLVDKWRAIPFFNSAEIPFRKSNLKVLKAIQNNVFAFSEDGVFVSRVNDKILTSEGGTVLLGNPTVLNNFESVTTEDFPIQGMRSHFDMVDVPQGIVYVDSKGRNVFALGATAEDLAVKGLKRFFEDNTRFILDEQFKSVLGVAYPIYSTFHPIGIGFALGYDPYHERVLITKRDFEIKKEYLNSLSGSASSGLWLDLERYRTSQFHYGSIPLRGFPSQYFIDRSFTVSYSLISGAWTSFHSYRPRHYFNDRVYLYSNDVYRHNNVWHGIFYGNTAPFIVDFAFSHSATDQLTPSSLTLSAHKYYYEPTTGTYVRTERPFDTLVAYNTNQSSGELTCVYPNGPYVNEPPAQTELYLVDDVYRVSRFRDNTISNLFPIWTVNSTIFDKEPFTPNINYNTPATEQVRLKDTHVSFRLKANHYPNKITIDFAKLNYYLNPR